MIVVIIAGGSGTRLWPLSTPSFPKHLLRLTNEQSMLQNTYERAKVITSPADIYVITEAGHSDHVFTQLPEAPKNNVIIEPGRRGTASCFIAALDRISRKKSDEPVVFMHADHHIRDVRAFADTVKYAGRSAKKEKKIVLLGVEPSYPATGFGYIQKGDQISEDGGSFVYTVKNFKEKPDYAVAQDYVKSGNYLWNMGYFVAPVNVFLQKMKDYAPAMFTDYQALQDAKGDKEYEATYLGFENIAIDYALIERTPDLLVVPGSFDWMDVGSFGDLHEVSDLDEQKNHLRGGTIELNGVENSYIRNEDDKPVAVIGLDNVVVVNSPNGVLVARKDLAQKVGEIAKKLQAKQS